jgi:trehalose 6-phosphate phosphatase
MSASAEVADLISPLRARPGASAVLSDIDGTLAPIVQDPEAAAVPEPAREVLRELAARYALVGCLSGRRAGEARRLVGLDELAYAGNHGFELLMPGEADPRLDPVLHGREHQARAFAEGLERDRLAMAGLRVEDKGPIQAFHWRGSADEAAARARAEEVAALAEARGLVPRWGRKVLEVRAIGGIDKGSVVARLLDGEVENAFYGGDDITDVDAFRALARMRSSGRLLHSVCVGVASGEAPQELAEHADLLVDGPEGYLEVLRALAA